MGSGIAQVAATAGFPTIVRDVTEPLLERGRAGIRKSLDKLVEKAKLDPAARETALGRLTFTTDLRALSDRDLVIEAVTEDLELKNGLWRVLDALCPPATLFASNTSSLAIAQMAAATARPDRFVGLHFFNPVPLMPLVEVVRAVTTSTESFERALEFARRLGKEPIVARDRSGFIVNLLLVPYLLDAVRALERGVGTTSDIDRGMQLGCGHPMGPLALLDFVGLDTAADRETVRGVPRAAPASPPLLRRMVVAGLMAGNGKGFYDYRPTPAPSIRPLRDLMFGYDRPRLHAVNDLPAALLFAVLFDLPARYPPQLPPVGSDLRGGRGAAAAVLSGLQAEESIDHGDAVHRVMETHELLAFVTLGIFAVLALWRVVRQKRMGTAERSLALAVSLGGVGVLIATAAYGGRLVFEHAAGIPTEVLQAEIESRGGGHAHAPGEEHGDTDPAPVVAGDSTAPPAPDSGAASTPGTVTACYAGARALAG
jgi:3-hydroxybutyryl-CoA dehydrogenase